MNVFHCFACQASGDVLDFVAAMEKCSIRQAALCLQQWFSIGAPGPCPAHPEPRSARQEERVREKEGCNRPLRFALTGVDASHRYLIERGIDRATAVEFGVGFYAGPGLLSERIVIPIRNARGQRVAYAGRALDGKEPKYHLSGRCWVEVVHLPDGAQPDQLSLTAIQQLLGRSKHL